MQLPRIFSGVTKKHKPCPHAELLLRYAGEFKMEGEANPADVARAIRIMGGGDGHHSMVYSTHIQMSRRAARVLIGSPGLSLVEAAVVRAVRDWTKRQGHRFQRR